jgi:protein-S-isoprenylcysteine O-methyltransferase Ste14
MGTIVVPAVLLLASGDANLGWGLPFPASALPLAAGGAAVAGGLTLIVETITLFARVGRGTLAPWDPTERLVVEGPYRHVRNPMITGVLLVLLGEAAICGSLWILGWALLFFAANAVWFPLVEEPALARRFGADYEAYRHAVPRWVPRLRPWRG